MIIIYLIPSGAYLVAFLFGLALISGAVESISTIAIIFTILTMLCPAMTSSFAMMPGYEKKITRHRNEAIILMTITSVVSTAILFIYLKSRTISDYAGISGLFEGFSDIMGMGLRFLIVLVVCCFIAGLIVENNLPPLYVALIHILLTAGSMVVVCSQIKEL